MDNLKRILRVFLRRTAATPPPGEFVWILEKGAAVEQMLLDAQAAKTRTDDRSQRLDVPREAEEIHISVVFTWDLERAHALAKTLEPLGLPVTVGGPATGMRGEEFTPGFYMRDGYVITSRGCPNRCWFCSVWKRDGMIRELPITDGWNVSDDNILATSETHFRAVFKMLEKYRGRVEFTGGLEAKILKPWHVDLLADIRPKQMFFAYDTPDDYEPLVEAGKLLRAAGFQGKNGEVDRRMRSFVFIGFPKDAIADAEKRMWQTLHAGFMPMAMLWRDPRKNVRPSKEWRTLQRGWARPAAMASKLTGVEIVKPKELTENERAQGDLFGGQGYTCG